MITSRQSMLESSWRWIVQWVGQALPRHGGRPCLSILTQTQHNIRAVQFMMNLLQCSLTASPLLMSLSAIPAAARTYVSAAATAGAAPKARDDQKYRMQNRAGSAVDRMAPLSNKSYGRLGQPANQLLNELTILACSSGPVVKAQFVKSALRELSASPCHTNHDVVAAYATLNVLLTGIVTAPHSHSSLACFSYSQRQRHGRSAGFC